MRSATDSAGGRCVHELIQACAREGPERIAITFENRPLTYRELNARANQLARHLRARGISTGAVVGLCAGRSPEMVVAMLGILKAGAAYLPLDPAFPAERIAHMIADSATGLIVTEQSLAGELPAGRTPLLLLDASWPEIERESGEDLGEMIPAESLAYLIYTSGSTGKPKGIAIEHRSVVNFLESMRREPGLGADDTLLAVTTISFDIAALEIFLPLSTGAHILLASRENALDAGQLAKLLDRATVMQATPATWRMLVQSGWRGKPGLKILCGGEALAPDLARHLLSRCGELWNMYGPTETTIWSTCHRIETADALIPVGRPIANTTVYVLGEERQPQPAEAEGELYIGGAGLARGYHNLPELTAQKFIPDPFASDPGARLYATGDLGRILPDGTIFVLGRIDRQVKIRGFRIETAEIEMRLNEFPGVRQSAVIDRRDASGEKILAAYLESDTAIAPVGELRSFLAEHLPGHMIPSAFVMLERLPLTPNGKIDYRALPAPASPRPALSVETPRNALEKTVSALWSEVLSHPGPGLHANFFDLGGTSLKLADVHSRLVRALGREISVTALFQYPTIASLASFLAAGQSPGPKIAARSERARGGGSTLDGIAIIGMAGRFPGARDVTEFWRNLLAGKDSVTHFSDEQLAAQGYDAKALRALPGYVAARGVVEKGEWFDRAFFGISPKEAEAMDPQHRLILELAWEALEDAACDASRFPGRIGIFAGMSDNSYHPYFVHERPDLMAAVGAANAAIGNEKDFLATRVAYKLNLRGPALSIQTACSSSLVTVCVACQNLLARQCDIALAGGVSLTYPQDRGYFFQDGSITSPEGRCRPFDARANGTVFSSGAGVVVLKPLRDAIADGDAIYAVIKGHALNNDGARKVSYAAPSVDAHAEVITLAQSIAGVAPETVSYIEAHGTATALGDPVEIAAFTQAFRAGAAGRQFCAVGSVKGNIGHCDAAAGVVGLIKTSLSLRHGKIPASINCELLNPALRIEDSPFFINTALREWPRDPSGAAPRRAGVSSLGIGGTNAHIVLEEAPAPEPAPEPEEDGGGMQLLLLSAKTATALDRRASDLAAHLEAHPETVLADVAWTLQSGRQILGHRRALCARTREEAIAALRDPAKLTRIEERIDAPVAFLFPGQGAQYAGMGAGLYGCEPVFRGIVDRCSEIFRDEFGFDLREVIFSKGKEAEARLRETRFTQPAIFTIGCALGRLWLSRGVQPAAMLGHSVGEFAAAALAGVFSLEEGARLVATRALLVQELPAGAMLAARVGESEAGEFLIDPAMDIAAFNSPKLSVFSGPFDAIAALEEKFRERNIAARRLSTSHAFHSPMVEAAVPPFAKAVAAVPLRAPELPIVSSVTGQWLTGAQATDPQYWTTHMRAAVRFSDAVSRLFEIKDIAMLEAGPGQTLGQLARQCPRKAARTEIAHSIEEGVDEEASLATALGRLWLAGAPADWAAVHRGAARRRISLPAYPFERQRYFADLPAGVPLPLATAFTDGEAPADASAAVSAPRLIEEKIQAPSDIQTEPASPEDEALAQLKELLVSLSGLELAAVSPAATLLDLGFDSLFLSQVARAVSHKFGVKITVRQLLHELGTLKSLAGHLSGGQAGKSADAPKTTPAVAREAPAGPDTRGRIPLTESQREVWLVCQQSDTASSAFNETWTLWLEGALDAPALRAALQTIVDRHDALRCTFERSGETLALLPALTLGVPLIDLSALPVQERDAQFAAIRAAEGRRVFDLENGPLIAAQLIRLAPEEHALVFNAHHLVCDGWSCDILLGELAAIYSARRDGAPPALPRPMSLREYQHWEAALRQTAGFEAEMKFWREMYGAPPPPLELPGDRPLPAHRSYRGSVETLTLPPEFAQDLARLGARHGATLFTVLLAAYKTLLFRLSGQSDLCVGIPCAGQNDVPGGERLVGHCVNLLPLRSRLDGSQTFESLLGALQSTMLEAFEHPHITFGWLIKNLALAREQGRVPLVSATFNLNPPLSHLRFPGLTHRLEQNPHEAFQFDFTISCDSSAERLRLICRYNTDLLDPATARRWLEHFRTILDGALADPSQTLEALPLLREPERRMLLEDWNRTGRDFPRDATLHSLFEAAAGRAPDSTALIFESAEITFAGLNVRANRLAHRLRRLGVGRDVPVGVCLERCAELPVALLAVLKAGGAYVPMDPSYPAERISFMAADAHCPVTITHSRWRDRFDEDAPVLCVDAVDLGNESAANPALDVRPDDLAYIIYTSGSTGRPKGAMIPHRAICNHMLWMQEEFPIDARDRVLQKTPISFDASVWEFWAPLLAGARLVLAAPDAHRDSRRLIEEVIGQGITVLQLVPSMLRMLAAEPRFAQCATLRRLYCGGEPLTPELSGSVLASLGSHCELINLYGPTECAIDATFHRCLPAEARVPIGRPVANTRLYILDARQQPAPIGIPGQLYIAGEQLARGYVANPELTAEKFIHLNGERVYRTGDLARWLPDGEVEFLGRSDDQVKVRGFRIELGEIESCIRRQPSIRDCAVAVHDGRLVAYIVQTGPGAARESLSLALSGSLPDYMVPAHFVFLPELPRTPGGKLDRRSLPVPGPAGSEAGPGVSAAPRTALEAHIAGIWRSVLNLPQVGIHENFFELGGESLLGLRVLNRLRDLLNENIVLSVIFEAQTIAALAALLERSYPAKVANLPEATGPAPMSGGAAPEGPAMFKQIARIPRKAAKLHSGGLKS